VKPVPLREPPSIDVVWVPSEIDRIDLPECSVSVIDVIRATTSIVTALESGAASVVPAATEAEAREISEKLPAGKTLLCGEERGVRIEGYDLGNSPSEYTPAAVGGKSLVYRTTNGTPAMRRALEGKTLRLACFRNAGAICRLLLEDLASDTMRGGAVLVCSGRAGRVSMDDAWCAGHLVERLCAEIQDYRLTDAAQAAFDLARSRGKPTPERLADTSAGRALGTLGLGGDLEVCADLDGSRVVPTWWAGAFVRAVDERKGG
jgi:2-phosphosulfolactate phosphatase